MFMYVCVCVCENERSTGSRVPRCYGTLCTTLRLSSSDHPADFDASSFAHRTGQLLPRSSTLNKTVTGYKCRNLSHSQLDLSTPIMMSFFEVGFIKENSVNTRKSAVRGTKGIAAPEFKHCGFYLK